MPRLIYIQYTNPAGYPPLEHSSSILAGQGWRILFLGTLPRGSHTIRFPRSLEVEVKTLPHANVWMLRVFHYAAYTVWVIGWCCWFRPSWVYASDALSCPA